MTEINQDIKDDFYAGNSKNIRVTVVDKDEQPFNLNNCEITYAITDEDEAIRVVKNSRDSSQITIEVSPNNEFVVHLLPGDTAFLNGLFRHMANVVDTNGYEETVMTGKVQIFKSYALRPRQTSMQAYLLGG